MTKFEVGYRTKENLKMVGVKQLYTTFAIDEAEAIANTKLMKDAVLILSIKEFYTL